MLDWISLADYNTGHFHSPFYVWVHFLLYILDSTDSKHPKSTLQNFDFATLDLDRVSPTVSPRNSSGITHLDYRYNLLLIITIKQYLKLNENAQMKTHIPI